MTDRVKLLGHEKINKLIASFSIPAIVGMLVMASYNVVDRIFVGHGVGTLAISAIAITFPLNIIVMGFGMLVGMGAMSLISLKLGAKDKDGAEHILNNAFVMSLIIAFALTFIIYFTLDPIIKMFGGTGQVYTYADQYLRVFIWGIPLQFLAFSLNGVIRAEGNPNTALATLLISGLLNILLNPIFIFVFHMGVIGSAAATVVAQFVGAVWVIAYFTSKRSFLRLKLKSMALKIDVMKQILSIGFPPFIMQIAGSVIIFIFNNTLLQYGGDTAVAAMAIGNSIMMLIMFPIFGLNQGIQPIIGFNYGAKQIPRVKETLKKGFIIATIICTTGFLIVMFFSVGIVKVFSSNDAQLVNVGAHGMRIFLIMLPLSGFQIVTWAYFQAVGKPRQSMLLTLSKQVVLIIPLIIILPRFFQLDGIWMAGPVADFISAIFAGTLMLFEMKKLNMIKPAEIINN